MRPPAPSALRPAQPISEGLRKALRHLEAELSKTETGRRLLAETRDVPVVERRRRGLGEDFSFGVPVRYSDREGVLFVDADLAPLMTSLDFETYFVRERRRALIRAGIPIFEDEMAAHQEEAAYAVEKAAVDADFSKELRRTYGRAEELFRSRRSLEDAARGQGLRAAPPWRPPKDPLARLAQEIYLFSEDPYMFYAGIEEGLEYSSETIRLDEAADFLELHGAGLGRLEWRARGRYCLAGGRLYPGAVARAALALKDREGLLVLRERLGPFMSVGREELRSKANRWIRERK